MKIIRRGKLPAERVWRGTCYHCDTIAEANEGELTITDTWWYDGTSGYTKCPLCKQRMCFYPQDTAIPQ